MKSIDLIRSFKKQANFSEYKDDEGKPYKGSKWLTVKQMNFLWSLVKKEDPKGVSFIDSFSWSIDGYRATLGRTAPNGCRTINFLSELEF